jgi:uncharacterized damage-inducible protein DinB
VIEGKWPLPSMPHKYTASYIEDSLSLFRYYKMLGEGAIRQVSDDQLAAALDSEMNSIALIVKHIAGNMRSRWTDFLSTDGEKPDRNRDTEFLDPPADRQALLEMWERGWSQVFAAIESLSDDDLARTVEIRGEAHSVMQAINRQIAHYSYHVGQIVFLAKHFRHSDWQSLSVPRGQSANFNRRVKVGEASQR